LSSFANRSRGLAELLGTDRLELFGAEIQNPRLQSLLLRRGFEPGPAIKIDAFGFTKEVPTLRRQEKLINGR
jgi:hypothetical protein